MEVPTAVVLEQSGNNYTWPNARVHSADGSVIIVDIVKNLTLAVIPMHRVHLAYNQLPEGWVLDERGTFRRGSMIQVDKNSGGA
jgi:hypothetical protein